MNNFIYQSFIYQFLNMYNNQLSSSGNKDLAALDIYSLTIGVTEDKLSSFGVTFKIVS